MDCRAWTGASGLRRKVAGFEGLRRGMSRRMRRPGHSIRSPVFRMAGLDPAQFKEVPPTYAPPLAFDARKAWSGVYPGLPDTPVTVEMASWRGNLTSLQIRWPWTKPVTPVEEPRASA